MNIKKLFLYVSSIYNFMLYIIFFIDINLCGFLYFYKVMFDVALIASDKYEWEIIALIHFMINIIFLTIVFNFYQPVSLDYRIPIVYALSIILITSTMLTKILIEDKITKGDWFDMFKTKH